MGQYLQRPHAALLMPALADADRPAPEIVVGHYYFEPRLASRSLGTLGSSLAMPMVRWYSTISCGRAFVLPELGELKSAAVT
jgi:hypothetical protein